MEGLTPKQQNILAFIKSFSSSKGFPPTLREIGLYFKISPPSVLEHLRALEKKGFIRRLPFKPRCLEVIREGSPNISNS